MPLPYAEHEAIGSWTDEELHVPHEHHGSDPTSHDADEMHTGPLSKYHNVVKQHQTGEPPISDDLRPSSPMPTSSGEATKSQPYHVGERPAAVPSATTGSSFFDDHHAEDGSFRFDSIDHPKKLENERQMRAKWQSVMDDYLRRKAGKGQGPRYARSHGREGSRLDPHTNEETRPDIRRYDMYPSSDSARNHLTTRRSTANSMKSWKPTHSRADMRELTEEPVWKLPLRSNSMSAVADSHSGGNLSQHPDRDLVAVQAWRIPTAADLEHDTTRQETIGDVEWCLTHIILFLLRMLCAGPAAGKTRLYWVCPCGQLMHGDYALRPGVDYSEFMNLLHRPKRPKSSFALILGHHRRRLLLERLSKTDPKLFFGAVAAGLVIIFDVWAQRPLFLECFNAARSFTEPSSGRVWLLGETFWLSVTFAFCIQALYASGEPVDEALEKVHAAPLPGNRMSTAHAQGNSNVGQGRNFAAQPIRRSANVASAPSLSGASTDTAVTQQKPLFFELCVSKGRHSVSLGEIQLRNRSGQMAISTDADLFTRIRQRYDGLSRKGLHRLLYRPSDIHFVRFAVQAGGKQVGIYDGPMAIPPVSEVKAETWHYYQCPLDPLPPIDRRTFYHFFYGDLADHPPSGSKVRDMMYYNRLPKKLNTGMLSGPNADDIFGWGVHIIEGPNKPVIAWFAAIIILVSFVVALVYDILKNNSESGFAIGQWLVAVLSAALTATYFHLEDIA